MPLIGALRHKELFLEGLGGGDSEQSSLSQTLGPGDLGEGVRRSLHMRAGVPFQMQTL